METMTEMSLEQPIDTLGKMPFQIPQIAVYWDVNYGGREFRTNLNALYLGDIWSNQISSFIIVSGYWQFFKDANFREPMGPVFGPGYYPSVEAIGLCNDSISSFKCIAY